MRRRPAAKEEAPDGGTDPVDASVESALVAPATMSCRSLIDGTLPG